MRKYLKLLLSMCVFASLFVCNIASAEVLCIPESARLVRINKSVFLQDIDLAKEPNTTYIHQVTRLGDLAVTPDGKQLYLESNGEHAVTIYNYDPESTNWSTFMPQISLDSLENIRSMGMEVLGDRLYIAYMGEDSGVDNQAEKSAIVAYNITDGTVAASYKFEPEAFVDSDGKSYECRANACDIIAYKGKLYGLYFGYSKKGRILPPDASGSGGLFSVFGSFNDYVVEFDKDLKPLKVLTLKIGSLVKPMSGGYNYGFATCASLSGNKLVITGPGDMMNFGYNGDRCGIAVVNLDTMEEKDVSYLMSSKITGWNLPFQSSAVTPDGDVYIAAAGFFNYNHNYTGYLDNFVPVGEDQYLLKTNLESIKKINDSSSMSLEELEAKGLIKVIRHIDKWYSSNYAPCVAYDSVDNCIWWSSYSICDSPDRPIQGNSKFGAFLYDCANPESEPVFKEIGIKSSKKVKKTTIQTCGLMAFPVPAEEKDVPVKEISFNKNVISLTTPDSKDLLAVTVKPEEATNRELAWSIAASGNGQISDITISHPDTLKHSANVSVKKFVAGATYVVTAKTTDGSELEAKCEIKTPSHIYPESVEIKNSEGTANRNFNSADEKDTLTALVTPDYAEDKSLVWSITPYGSGTASEDLKLSISSDTHTVEVSVTNFVFGGKYEIVAAASDKPEVNGKYTITNRAIIPVAEVKLDKTSKKFVDINDTDEITADILPSNTDNKSLSWSVKASGAGAAADDVKITSLDSEELKNKVKVSLNKYVYGAAYEITAEAVGGIKTVYKLTTSAPVLVTEIQLDKTENNFSKADDTDTITANVLPDTASNSTLKWTVSTESTEARSDDVRIVDQSGSVNNGQVVTVSLVRFVANAEYKLTATAADGSGVTAVYKLKTPVVEGSSSVIKAELPASFTGDVDTPSPEVSENIEETSEATGLSKESLEINAGKVSVKTSVAADIAGKIFKDSFNGKSVKPEEVQPLPIFTAPVSKGKISMFSIVVTGKDLFAKEAKDVKLLKIKGDAEGLKFIFKPEITGEDGTFVLQNMDSTLNNGVIKKDLSYKISLFIKEGGDYDTNSASDKITDPVVIVKKADIEKTPDTPSTPSTPDTPASSGGSGGGCNAGFAGMLLLGLVPAFIFRKKD